MCLFARSSLFLIGHACYVEGLQCALTRLKAELLESVRSIFEFWDKLVAHQHFCASAGHVQGPSDGPLSKSEV